MLISRPLKTIPAFSFIILFCLPLLAQAREGQHGLRYTPVVRAVEKTSPAVVNIKASKVIERQGHPFADFYGPDDWLSPFFREFAPKQKYVQKSLGSGVIIDGQKRYVLTNAHVITGASDIRVHLLDGRNFKAELIGSEPDFDLALLKLSGKGDLPEVLMGGSEDLMIGETVVAIGNPYGFRHTVTTGVISALDRTIETKQGTFMGFIQTDAAINPGNSGGPLLNIKGEVVGINTAIYAKAQGIGFAIPINKAKRVVEELVDYGYVQPVWLGIAGQNIDQRTAGYFGLPEARGMLVTEVYKDTPAQEIGLQPGDIVLGLSGRDIMDKEHYSQVLRNVTKGTELSLVIWRNGSRQTLETEPEALKTDEVISLAYQRWGMRLQESGHEKGLVITEIRSKSPAGSLGLRPGDKVYKIAGQVMASLDDFVQAFIRYRMQNNLLLLIVRQGHGYYLRLKI